MLAHARLGARFLAGALALTLLPAFALAQDPATSVNPWKLGYAKRLADERLAERRAQREREDRMRDLARAARRGGKTARRTRGENARPALPGDLPVSYAEPNAPRRTSRPFGVQAFTPPANHIVNNRAGDFVDSGQSETSIAAFGDKLLAAWNDGQGFPAGDTQGWGTSIDGGVTWTDRDTLPSTVPGVSSFKWTSDPVLTVNEKTGAFYFSALCDFSDAGGMENGVAVVKGRWNGNVFTWGTPVIARSVSNSVDFVDKEWVVADSVSDRVFLTYSRFPGGLSRIEFQYADSSLSAFSTPQPMSLNTSVENGFVQASRPIVDGDGHVYVMYYLIGQGESDFYRVRRSNNNGATFASPVSAESLYTNFGTGSPGFNRPIGVQFAGISVDRSLGAHRGRLYLSWAESIDWLDDVFNIGQSGNKNEIEPNNTPPAATPATVGQTLRGTISSLGDIDLYAVPLVAGQHLIAAADSTQSVGELTLRLIAEDGQTSLTFTTFDATVNPSAQNPQGIPSGWLFTAPVTGTYYVRVAARTGTGSYRLRLGLADRASERGRDQRDAFVAWSDNGTNWSVPTRVNEELPGYDDFLPEVNVAPDGGVYCAWFDYHDAAPLTDGGEAGLYIARSGDGGLTWTTLGAVADTLSNWTSAATNIEPNQGDYLSLFSTSSSIWPCWSDARRGNPDVFTAQIPLIPNGAQVAFRNLQLGYGRISMSWLTTPADTLTMRLYRSDDNGPYQYLTLVQFDATGALAFTDTTVVGNHVYAYRLGRFTGGIELFYGQVRVFLPNTFPLSMSSPRPNPVTGTSFVASFSLATNEPADLILYDISGREVLRQTVNPGVGPHTVALSVGHGLRQGLYVLMVRQSGHKASARLQLVR